ncbi:GNAT family N-acetyltransferase [Sinosporangium album]|uniref:GNAT family N-acetyltransferase n=1 Tax=Sinosporangium album TaxID=504805 RepID=UPI001FDED8CB|nr:GNAT family N-acetyltransferase [Sinosporangium album]
MTPDITRFPESAETWLLHDTVRNTVVLTVLNGVRAGLWVEDPLLAWYERGGDVHGLACHTPPHNLLLPDLSLELVGSLAAELIDMNRKLPGVSGPLPAAEAFAAHWWRPERRRRAERLYRLGTLTGPTAPPVGRARTATADDLPTLVSWITDFEREAGIATPVDPTPAISRRLTRAELVWWETGDGRPAALAAASTPIAGMSRVGPVYTPPELRGHGYGSAVTDAVTRHALSRGAREVLLFTDLANPTSNRLYQRLGYEADLDYASI